MSKQSIIMVVLLVAALAALAAGFQLVIVPLQAQLAEDQEYLERLESRLETMRNTFSSAEPELVVSAWREAVQPWSEAVQRRRQVFSMDDALAIEEVPEGKIARFHYEEQYEQMMTEYQQEVMSRGISAPFYGFGVPYPDQLTSASLTEEEVEAWLRQVAFGKDTVRLLMDAGAQSIGQIEIWPKRTQQGVLEMWTVGVFMWISWNDLVSFLDRVSAEADEYFKVEALRMVNSNLALPANSPLQVQMIITRANYDETGQLTAEAPAGPQAGGMGMPSFPGGGMGPMGF